MKYRKNMLALLIAGSLLTACGGSGSDISGGSSSDSSGAGTDTDTSSTYAYSLSVNLCSNSDATSCDAITEATLDSTNYVAVRLVDKNNNPVAGKVVTISTDLGSIKPTTGKLTDVNGYAVFAFTSSDLNDAGQLSNITVTNSDAETVTKSVSFGSQADLAFTFSTNTETLAQGSTAALNIAVTLNGEAYSTPVTINFSSTCKSAGTAILADSVTTNSSGLATLTYKGVSADGSLACAGADKIIASLASDSTNQQSITINNDLAETSTIIAGTPSPAFLRLKGYNGSTSQITFTVKNSQGTVVPSQSVNFAFSSISPLANGYSLSPSTATTDANGRVAVTVNAGTLPVPVAVRASIPDSNIQAVSLPIAVGTGYTDSDSFSFAADNYSLEGRSTDGSTATITMRLADRFNNPVPDGTKVYFTAEGGSIKGNYTDSDTGSTPDCITSDSTCTATLTTMNPRPEDGRVTILAYTEGEESFADLNGNGLLDSADYQTSSDMPYFDDISEPFLDENYDGLYSSGENFPDLNGNAQWDSANSKYNGLSCEQAVVDEGKCERSTVQLYVNSEFIFSSITDGAHIILEKWNGSKWVTASGALDVATIGYYRFLPFNIATTGVYNPLPSGAQISVATTNGGEIVTGRPADFVPGTISQESDLYLNHQDDINTSTNPDITAKIASDATRPYFYYFIIKPETTANNKTNGTLTIKASTAAGSSTGAGGSVAITRDANDNG